MNEKEEKERQQRMAKREADAKACEPDALAQRGDLFAKAVAEEEAQRKGFAFECVRLGTFLTIKTTRAANTENQWPNHGKEFSTAINLSLVPAIDLKRGHAADCLGTLTYGEGWGSEGQKVRANLPYVPEQRMHFIETPKQHDPGYYDTGNGIKFATPAYVRTAEDDAITFKNFGTLYVPFGLGESIHKKILAAT